MTQNKHEPKIEKRGIGHDLLVGAVGGGAGGVAGNATNAAAAWMKGKLAGSKKRPPQGPKSGGD